MQITRKEIDIAALLTRLKHRGRRLGADAATAEDLAQEAALRLIETMAQKTLVSPERYAMIILHNLARARWRNATGYAELCDDSATTLPVADARLNIDALTRAIAALPPDQAAVIRLVLGGSDSPHDIAEILGIPPGTAMSRLARARSSLRLSMGLGKREKIRALL